MKNSAWENFVKANADYKKYIELETDINKLLWPKQSRIEWLLKSVFSPQTWERTSRVLRQIRDEFWVDLINEAKLAKYAMEAVWDERWINLLEAVVWDLWWKVWAVKKTAQIVYNPKKVWLDLAWKNINKWFENKIKVPKKEDLEKFKVKNDKVVWKEIKVPNKWKTNTKKHPLGGFEPSPVDVGNKITNLQKKSNKFKDIKIPNQKVDFGEWLEKINNWTLKSDNILVLWNKKEWILNKIFWNVSLYITQWKLKKKLNQHWLTLNDIKDLDKEINNPILVYKSWTKHKANVIITNLSKWKDKIAVVIWDDIRWEITDIKSIHPKEIERLVDEAKEWKIKELLFEDNKKIQEWTDSASSVGKQSVSISWILNNYTQKIKKSNEIKLPPKMDELISQKQAKEIVEKYFKPEEVWVDLVDTIKTRKWQEAFWMYKDRLITFAKDPIKNVPEHEVLHAYFDLAVPQKKFIIIMKKSWRFLT